MQSPQPRSAKQTGQNESEACKSPREGTTRPPLSQKCKWRQCKAVPPFGTGSCVMLHRNKVLRKSRMPSWDPHPARGTDAVVIYNMTVKENKCCSLPRVIGKSEIRDQKKTQLRRTGCCALRSNITMHGILGCTSCQDCCTHLATDHQTVPARDRHCSVAEDAVETAFWPAGYSGPQDRLSHSPQRRKC